MGRVQSALDYIPRPFYILYTRRMYNTWYMLFHLLMTAGSWDIDMIHANNVCLDSEELIAAAISDSNSRGQSRLAPV